jgi:hypothetical protein
MHIALDFTGHVWLGSNSLFCQKFVGQAELKSSEIHTKNETNVVNAPQPRDHYDI